MKLKRYACKIPLICITFCSKLAKRCEVKARGSLIPQHHKFPELHPQEKDSLLVWHQKLAIHHILPSHSKHVGTQKKTVQV